jgi:hypothetical protein
VAGSPPHASGSDGAALLPSSPGVVR